MHLSLEGTTHGKWDEKNTKAMNNKSFTQYATSINLAKYKGQKIYKNDISDEWQISM